MVYFIYLLYIIYFTSLTKSCILCNLFWSMCSHLLLSLVTVAQFTYVCLLCIFSGNEVWCSSFLNLFTDTHPHNPPMLVPYVLVEHVTVKVWFATRRLSNSYKKIQLSEPCYALANSWKSLEMNFELTEWNKVPNKVNPFVTRRSENVISM